MFSKLVASNNNCLDILSQKHRILVNDCHLADNFFCWSKSVLWKHCLRGKLHIFQNRFGMSDKILLKTLRNNCANNINKGCWKYVAIIKFILVS